LGEENAVVSRFGWEDSPAGKRQWNSGVRIAAAPGAPVRAVLPGTVVYAGPRDGYGNTVVLEHKGGFRSYYGNVDLPSLQVGEKIKHGAEFASVATQPFPGAEGENSAILHFELKKGEMALNPESAIRRLTLADG
jgi:murein DD-endopeptidase MepM/ murein hydrolase activator NlpD